MSDIIILRRLILITKKSNLYAPKTVIVSRKNANHKLNTEQINIKKYIAEYILCHL